MARATALKPSSISSLALSASRPCSLACDQVCAATVCPRRATSRTMAGSAAAMRPTMKNVALVQWASSALRTAWVWVPRGPVVEGEHDLAVGEEIELARGRAPEHAGPWRCPPRRRATDPRRRCGWRTHRRWRAICAGAAAAPQASRHATPTTNALIRRIGQISVRWPHPTPHDGPTRTPLLDKAPPTNISCRSSLVQRFAELGLRACSVAIRHQTALVPGTC